MRVLLDECVPARLGRELSEHTVSTVPREGWAGISNGQLLAEVEAANCFSAFVTVDKNLPSQQVIRGVSFAIVVLRAPSNSIDDLLPLMPDLRSTLEAVSSGEVVVLGD